MDYDTVIFFAFIMVYIHGHNHESCYLIIILYCLIMVFNDNLGPVYIIIIKLGHVYALNR